MTMNIDGLAKTGIPYLSMIKKAMPKETTSKKKKFKDREDMKTTIENLMDRIKKLEEWQ